MKYFRKILFALLLLVALLAIGGVVMLQTLKPDYDGVKELPGISGEVSVYFDSFGVPHIYAQTEGDAFRALGYVHAQDRLWQMELLRRVARGGLSEIFGKDLLDTDRFFLSLGIAEASRQTVASLDPASPQVKLARAYLEGVNYFIESGPTPVEFYLTGLEKTHFTLEDMHNAIGYMAFSFAMAHKTDPLLTIIRDSLGSGYYRELAVLPDTTTVRIRSYLPPGGKSAGREVAGLVPGIPGNLPVPQFEGSNSWVLSPARTRKGEVILANDPHIGFAQPSVWYEAHLVAPGYEKYGFHLAGIPFPLLGHDRNLAYGLTMFENDDINFYYEKGHLSDSLRYRDSGEWVRYGLRADTIRVKGADPVVHYTRTTRNGPVLRSLGADTLSRPVSMSWTYTRRSNKLLEVLYGMSHAVDLQSFQQPLHLLHAPGLNVMYGDAEGNIAWWASAHLNTLGDSLDTRLIQDAADREAVRYLDFTANPQAVNPPWNYVYSANNEPEPVHGRRYPGYYLPENRARRIVEILESKDDWDSKSVSTMILDDTSPVNPEIVANLAKSLEVTELTPEELKLLDAVSAWKGNYPLKAFAPVIFHRWVYYFLQGTFADELGQDRFTELLNTHLIKQLIAPMSARESSIWWDDVTTDRKTETKAEIVKNAFRQAIQSLDSALGEEREYWTWDRVHQVEYEHPMGRVSWLRSFFNVGPFPVRGSREVINNLGFQYGEDIMNRVNSGPSTRRIIDFSDVEHSLGILPTGQSGNPLSPHYKDQAELYVNGKFRIMQMNQAEIKQGSESLLIFKTER